MTKTQTVPRYWVDTKRSGINRIANPYWVIDCVTNRSEEEYSSKKAAQMHAKHLNEYLPEPGH